MIPVQTVTVDGNYPSDGGTIHQGDTARGSAKNTLHAYGTFGSGTVVLQYKPYSKDGSASWRALADVSASLTANGEYNYELRGACHVRINVSGSTAASIEIGVL